MTAAATTFVVVTGLLVATLAAFVAREVVRQGATGGPPQWLTWAAWSLTAVWAAAVVWRFEVLG